MTLNPNPLDQLAFENGTGYYPPPNLWRVSSLRTFRDRPIRHVNWFATKDAADNHAWWLETLKATNILVTHYTRCGGDAK